MTQDFLRECNDKQVPLEDFQRAFCSRCLNPECSRSQAGKSRFDSRVSTWEDRLFTRVPEMAPNDPRYGAITGKRFLTLDTSRTPEVSSAWIDPRDASPEPLSSAAAPRPVSPENPVASQVPMGARNSTGIPSHLLLGNTPTTHSVMVGAGPTAAPKAPARDPWDPPEPPKDPIVAVGSRVKMGKPGV